MTKYFLKRLVLGFASVIIVAIIVYFLMGITKNSPINETEYASREAYLHDVNTLGLNKPIGTRFWIYITDIFTGKGFGQIYQKADRGKTIPALFFGPLIYTLWITVPAFIFSMMIGILLGFLSGYKRGTWIDVLINIFVIVFTGIPSFVLAVLFIFFGKLLGIPTSFISPDNGYKQMIFSLILPILIMTLTSLSAYANFARNEVITILNSNHVTIARAKGLDEWNIFKKHVIRNAAIPLMSLILNSFLILLAGSIVVETFFQVPGTSSILLYAVKNSEYNIVMFQTLFIVTIGLIIEIIIDILFVVLDPRIKYVSATNFKFIKYLQAKHTRSVKKRNLRKIVQNDEMNDQDRESFNGENLIEENQLPLNEVVVKGET